MQDFILNRLKYVVRYPNGFDQKKKYPVLLLLHGSGTRSNDTDKLHNNAFFTLTEKHADFPFVCVAPLCSEDTWFDMMQDLKTLVEHIKALPYADNDRFYVIGASMGGYATWQLAMSIPDEFAAIVPICGGGMYWNAKRLANLPVWAFHGAKDNTVLPEESQKMVDAVNRAGGIAKLTVYPENDHNSWSDTYSNPEVFEWLLKHRKISETQAQSIDFSNPVVYG